MNVTEEIIEKSGGVTALAKELGLSNSAVSQWLIRKLEVPPIKHAYKIEKITGIPKEKIWADYFCDGK